ncbi:hypothetical protein [Longimicrobium sp.]|uniref:hypothetical protein n=1 Tax=Longimicrobium sp. TaxID=2029185 RepID=UPI002E34D496|nr:hypothetical protein [Longimicrobium sp.]HEX6037137.1 hypothetical protein [Longimicrobium sp.]
MNATTAAPSRFVQVPATLLGTVRRFVVGDREPMEAVTVLREIGYELGDEVYGGLQARLSRDFSGASWDALDPAEFWRAAATFFADRGWGTLEFRDLHPAVGVLELTGWVESEAGGGPRGAHLSTGLFSALLERLAGAGVAVMEVPSGAADRTRLLFARGDVLGQVYEHVRGGARVEEALARLG